MNEQTKKIYQAILTIKKILAEALIWDNVEYLRTHQKKRHILMNTKKNYRASKASVEQKAKHSEYRKNYRASKVSVEQKA